MTSRQFLDFVKAKLDEHGVEKLVAEEATLEQHARRLIEQELAKKAIARVASKIAKEAASRKLPADLTARVAAVLGDKPHLPWDAALAVVLGEDN